MMQAAIQDKMYTVKTESSHVCAKEESVNGRN